MRSDSSKGSKGGVIVKVEAELQGVSRASPAKLKEHQPELPCWPGFESMYPEAPRFSACICR